MTKASMLPPLGKAWIGRYDLSESSSSKEFEEIDIEYAVTHPAYNANTYENGITIIKLKKESAYTPVTLDTTGSEEENTSTSVGTNVTVLGWGRVNVDDENNSDVLREGTGEIISNDECEDAYSEERWSVTDDMMCAAKDGKDLACYGDGGGPLIIKGSSNVTASEDIQVGIVSWGASECDVEGKPGVYVRVGEFVDFIECVTDGGTDCGTVVRPSLFNTLLSMLPYSLLTIWYALTLVFGIFGSST